MNKVLQKGSKRDEYYTPRWLWEALGPFDLDPCAGPVSGIATVNNRSRDGLEIEWSGFIWLNPPFSSKTQFLDKMRGQTGIAVLPFNPETKWFKSIIRYTKRVFLIGVRVQFIGGHTGNFGCNVLIPYGDEAVSRIDESSIPGYWMVYQEKTGSHNLLNKKKK